MYRRTDASSFPTVDTQYPLAHKFFPTKFFPRPAYTRAIWIALFPFRYPTTYDTEYFGGTEIIMCT
ncbi:MAG: hypothetical protein RLZZ408_416 [Verrucomicrobiota bacterium]